MNRFKNFTIIIIAVFITISTLLVIRLDEAKMDGIIKENHLRYTGEVKGANPFVTFTTVALGSFRGVIANLLWLRSHSLQDKGDYYEMVQLANWITDLQPEFSGASAYLAWNMAYNISVTCSFFEDRWRWVNEGIKLFRDKAIIYNPEDPVLYKELGWIFQHKIGNILDDGHQYYKNQLANDMRLVVTNEPDWEGIAAAPKTQEAFYEKYKGTAVERALVATNLVDPELLNIEFRKNSEVPMPLQDALKNDETIIHELDNYLRGQYLREKYKLDPDRILAINNEYGELDWRLPEAQSIYWAKLGLEKTPGNKSVDCQRMITQALFESFKSGKLLILDNKDFEELMLIPNFNVAEAVAVEYDRAKDDYPNIKSFNNAKEGFYKDSIMLMYNYGKNKEAQRYFEHLQEEYPNPNLTTMESFAIQRILKEVEDVSYKRIMDIIDGRLYQSFLYALYDEDDAAIANEKVSRAIYNKFQREHAKVKRLQLPPYNTIKKEVAARVIKALPKDLGDKLSGKLNLNVEDNTENTNENIDASVFEQNKQEG